MDKNNMINISGIEKESIVDGPGLRYTLFVQGCHHSCKGCHNPETHVIGIGEDVTTLDIYNDIKCNPLLTGLTISGGEPILQIDKLLPLMKKVKSLGLDIYIYKVCKKSTPSVL